MKRSTAALCVLLAALLPSCAQRGKSPAASTPAPGTEKSVKGQNDRLYDDSRLHTVDLELDKAVYDRLLAEHLPNGPTPPYRLLRSFSFDGLRIENVGMRGRGNSFSPEGRQSYKLKFDCADPLADGAEASASRPMDLWTYKGRTFLGQQSLNLRASNNDPTLVRELLAYKAFRAAGVPAPRASLALLRINGKPQGVYTVVEEVDKRFLKRWFDDASGDLYKCGWDQGQGASFFPGSFTPGRYDLSAGTGDQAALDAFMKDLAAVKSAAALEALVDKRNLLAYDAVCSLVGHWDSLNGNLNNDYVYRDPTDGKWRVIVWDCDNTFGSDWIPHLDTLSASLDSVAVEARYAALFCRLATRYWAADSRAVVRSLVTGSGEGGSFAAEAARLKALIGDAERSSDPYLELPDAFLAAFDLKPARSPFKGGNIEQFKPGVGLLSFYRTRLAALARLSGM